jgi:hypothetical protein
MNESANIPYSNEYPNPDPNLEVTTPAETAETPVEVVETTQPSTGAE